MKCLEIYIGKAHLALSPISFFAERPVVHFTDDLHTCKSCPGIPTVMKVRRRTVSTMAIGGFIANETVFRCPNDGAIYGSSELKRLVPERCRFGYDVIEYVGRAMFLESHRDTDIMSDLKSRGIEISDREVAFLGKKICGLFGVGTPGITP